MGDWGAMRRRATIVALTAVLGLASTACSDPDRSGARFCGELATELPGLSGPIGTSDDIDDLVGRYERLDAITPLAIEDEWHAITQLVRQAADVDISDPRSRQDLADAAYKAERKARDVTSWVQSTCALDMPDIIGIEGPDAPMTTVTPVTTLAPETATTVAP